MDTKTDLPLTLIENLYDAAADADKWTGCLAQIKTLFGLHAAQVGHMNPHRSAITFFLWEGPQYTPESFRRYEELSAKEEGLINEVLMKSAGKVMRESDMVRREQFHSTTMYKEVLAPLQIEYRMYSLTVTDTGIDSLGFMRSPGQGDFRDSDMELASALVPHFQRTMRFHDRMSSYDLQRHFVVQGMDALAVPVLVLDRDGQLLLETEAARELREKTGLLSGLTTVAATHNTPAIQQLHQASTDVIDEQLNDTVVAPRLVPLGVYNGDAVTALVTPLWRNVSDDDRNALRRPVAAVFLSTTHRRIDHAAPFISAWFGLTPRQGTLVAALIETGTLEEVAMQMGITLSTARTHLKQIFSRIGVGTQTAMVQKVLDTPLMFLQRRAAEGWE
jgi:DNA-binding CsgD family transcriptional regulator